MTDAVPAMPPVLADDLSEPFGDSCIKLEMSEEHLNNAMYHTVRHIFNRIFNASKHTGLSASFKRQMQRHDVGPLHTYLEEKYQLHCDEAQRALYIHSLVDRAQSREEQIKVMLSAMFTGANEADRYWKDIAMFILFNADDPVFCVEALHSTFGLHPIAKDVWH